VAIRSLEGQTVGKYRVLEPLGRGGMARVYRAYHPQLDRYVAIKVLRSDLVEDETFLARFRREAQAIAALRHPHIIQVYDFDVQDDITYMVMELMDGDTLHTRLNDYRVRDEQMPWGEMTRILLDVLDGLAYAHEESMIHRDIKPANILLTKKGQAVLADFGIAQIVGGTRHTVSGALLGTLSYMAPEQGLQGVSDVRSDIYSLGIVFYEMLTRQPPFNADTPLAILMKHVNDPLPLPRDLAPDIPFPFERIVLKALAKQPDDRYQLAMDMAAALSQAAAEAEIDIPDHISPPLSFTTQEAPSESVAVFSGTARNQITDSLFAAEQTDATLAEKLKAEQKALAGEPAPSDAAPAAESDTPESTAADSDAWSVTRSILNALGLLATGNLLLIMLSGQRGPASFYARGWPLELWLVTIGLCWIMMAARSIWIFIPAGIIGGNALLFSYYSLTGNWHQWTFLWPLEPFLVLGILVFTINVAQRGQRSEQLSHDLGRRLSWVSIVAAFLLTFIVLLIT
jgi:serine/threonine protein kinase